MTKFITTTKAGRRVAGHINHGVGSPLDITERTEALALALERGELVPADPVADEGEAPALTKAEKAAATKAAKKAEGEANA